MRSMLVVAAVSVACAAIFFFVPHHRRKPESFKPRTLGALYADLFDEAGRARTTSHRVMLLLAIAGIFSSFYPVVLVLVIRFVDSQSAIVLLIVGGLIGIVGAVANFLGMLISHMNFGWGGGGGAKDRQPAVVLIPMFQIVVAVAGIVLAAWPAGLRWAACVVGR